MTAESQPIAPTVSRRRLQPEVRKELVLDAAARILATEGIRAITMDRVGSEAGVSRSLLYLRFTSVEHILLELIQRETSAVDSRVLEALAGVSSLEERVRALIGPYFDVLPERLWLAELLNADHAARPLIQAWVNERTRVVTAFLVAELRAHFYVDTEVATLAIHAFTGAFSSVILAWGRGGLSRSSAEQLLVHLVMGTMERISTPTS